jgi:hypothetical protein
MRRLFIGLFIVVALLAALGVGAAVGSHYWGFARDASVTIDGVSIDEAGVGALIGVSVAVVAMIGVVLVVAVIASVAVLVPIALIVALLSIAFAMVIGLSPVLVPIALIVGVCVLLSRRSKRRTQTGVTTSVPPASTMS